MSRRNNLDICADILQIARRGAKKTEIVYGANLNFKVVEGYLRNLISEGLIQKLDRFFTTTPKGNQFVEQYRSMISPFLD